MKARNHRGGLTAGNVVTLTIEDADLVMDFVQDIIDNPEWDLPDEAVTRQNTAHLQRLYAYYGNQYPYLVGLWGRLSDACANGKNAKLMAMRNYLEKATSACHKKYEAASRMLTSYQVISEEGKTAKPW
jgi:hypothetical protein